VLDVLQQVSSLGGSVRPDDGAGGGGVKLTKELLSCAKEEVNACRSSGLCGGRSRPAVPIDKAGRGWGWTHKADTT
jgi:hypothetical protein